MHMRQRYSPPGNFVPAQESNPYGSDPRRARIQLNPNSNSSRFFSPSDDVAGAKYDHFSRVRLWPRFFDGTHPPSFVLLYPWSWWRKNSSGVIKDSSGTM